MPGKDATKSETSLVEAFGWIEAARGAAPPLAMVRPTATRQDANMAVVNAFFGQSSLTKAGFSKGGVVPFWESPLMSMRSLVRVGPDEMREVLARNPRALLIKSDLGSSSFFMNGLQKYIIACVDSWSTEEPWSRQPLKPIMSWSSFPTIVVKSSIAILASGHRLLNLQEIIDLPSERASLLSLSLSCLSHTGRHVPSQDVEVVHEGVRLEQQQRSCLGHEVRHPPLSGGARF